MTCEMSGHFYEAKSLIKERAIASKKGEWEFMH